MPAFNANPWGTNTLRIPFVEDPSVEGSPIAGYLLIGGGGWQHYGAAIWDCPAHQEDDFGFSMPPIGTEPKGLFIRLATDEGINEPFELVSLAARNPGICGENLRRFLAESVIGSAEAEYRPSLSGEWKSPEKS